MNKPRIWLLSCMALAYTTAAPASQKPCRGPDGKIVTCPKPKQAQPPRCRDDKGRFVNCPAPKTEPHRR